MIIRSVRLACAVAATALVVTGCGGGGGQAPSAAVSGASGDCKSQKAEMGRLASQGVESEIAASSAGKTLSPEAQARKADIAQWGDPTVLALDKLPAAERARFSAKPLPGQVQQVMPTIPEPHGSWVDLLGKEWLRRYGA